MGWPYLDDIIVTGRSDDECLKNLEAVLSRLEENGLGVKQEKCAFLQPSIEYLGHCLDKDGISPLPQKLDAIMKTQRPTNQTQLQTYLGLLGYYHKFIPNLSAEIVPLTELLKAEYA